MQTFLQGTAILLAANIFNRALGFIYQIVMMRLITPEGVGLFNIAFPIYVLIMVAASMGIPTAVAKLVAEEIARQNPAGAKKIFRLSLGLVLVLSLSLTGLAYPAANFLQTWLFPDPRVYWCFLALLPAIIIVSVCSVFRGYFQGLQMMGPTALTQAGEQIVRVIIGLGLAYYLLPQGIEYAAVGISLGVLAGELAGFLFMLGIYYQKKPLNIIYTSAFSNLRLSSKILALGFPVTLNRFASSLLCSIEAILIPSQLILWGLSTSEATAAYGQFVGISESLLYTPAVITAAMSVALIPAVSEAAALGNQRLLHYRSEESIRIAFLTGWPMVAVFLVLAPELCQVLFGYASAAPPLMIMALSGPFIYVNQILGGILNGLGKPIVPFKSMLLSSLFRIAGLYWLIPPYGLNGAALIMAISYFIGAALNYWGIKNITPLKIHWNSAFLKPLWASIICWLVLNWEKSYLLKQNFQEGAILLFSLLSGGLVYLLALILTGGIEKKDWQRMVFFR